MAQLKSCLDQAGFSDVSTFIASGNLILKSEKTAAEVRIIIEKLLPENFKLDSEHLHVLVLTRAQLDSVVANKPENFGDQPEKSHSDVIFLIDISTSAAMPVFNPRDGVDRVWPGEGVIYSERVSALRTKSRLGSIIGTPAYQTMTIRNWRTTTKLLELIASATT